MKKTLAVLLLSIPACHVYAQSSVTLYGIVDEGLTYVSNVKGHSNYVLDSGIIQGNRFGLRTVEDLGGGLSTIADIEFGFNLGTGVQASAFRQSYVGLVSQKWGQVSLGRQYDPMAEFIVNDSSIPYIGIYTSTALDIDRLAGEAIPNTIKYVSPEWVGAKIGAIYGFSNAAGAFGGTTNAPRWVGAAVSFDNHQSFGIATGFTNVNGSGGSLAQALTGANAQKVFDVGAHYTFEAVTIMGTYTRASLDGVPKLGTMRATEYKGMVLYQYRPDTAFGVGYNHSVWTQGRWGTFVANVDYLLSKRTDVYVMAAYQKSYSANIHPSIIDVNGAIGAPGAQNEAGASSNGRQLVTQIGIRTKF
ncbi:porin [Paraburkholderia sediminicola]|uniref:porin n=1 Tax=Paraburkholderia sediminicola TaxID=458836 RepID=UPI0038BA0332